MNRIRPIAICIFRNEKKILVTQAFDPIKNQTFYRPVGGGIEFGEKSEDTIHREIMEELKQAVTDLHYLATLENIFVYNGETGHEIVQVYDGKFVNSKLYEQPELNGFEEGAGQFIAIWKNIGEFNLHSPLYPHGLQDMLLKIM
jgi:8-oxo-dGTP pyrophosphatase MutT (NUDIX family)